MTGSRRARGLIPYGILVALLAAFGVAMSQNGPEPGALVPLWICVAVYASRGRAARCAGLIGCAGAMPLVATQDVRGAVFYTLGAAVGMLVGLGMRARWSYGRVVAVVTVTGFALCATYLAMGWQGWNQEAANALGVAQSQLERAQALPDDGSAAGERARLVLYAWMLSHWADVSVGIVFAAILLGVTLMVGVVSWWLRVWFRAPGVAGPFAMMRPPEWLVWLAILAAAGWFVDQRWPGVGLRPWSWSAAIGLGAVYWLNGLAIVVYALRALQVSAGMSVVAILAITMLPPNPPAPLVLIGLFDTWGDFRHRLDVLAEARRSRARQEE